MDKTLIKKPLLTEKTAKSIDAGTYTFVIKNEANKVEVKKIIETSYKVKVDNVRIINVKDYFKKNAKGTYKVSGFKKAIVKLRSGQKLEEVKDN